MKIAINSFYNIAGYVVPGILSIPILGLMSRDLGVERFGLFSIILALVGYASIFDIGITRSVIREISIFRDDSNEVEAIISTSLIVVGILGIISSLLICLFSPNILNFLKITHQVINDFKVSLILVAISIPFYLFTQIWCSLLEGMEDFLSLNIYKTFSGTLVVLLPALALNFDISLTSAVIGLVAARLISLLLIMRICRKFTVKIKFHNYIFKRLIAFGGWIAVSNIVSPIMSYFDRFILANRIGSASVGFYTAPSEAIARLGMIPSAIARTIFPILAKKEANSSEVKKFSYVLVLLIMLPITLIIYIYAKQIMSLWFGNEYAVHSYLILQILIIGLFFNSFAQIPFASIQGKGHSRITAILHLCEFLPYLFLLYYLISYYGLIGAAISWTVRMLFDCIVLIILDINEKQIFS